jgi:hypothetical protein
MNSALVIFWAVLIFASILWYGYLVFHIGIKAGREIRELTKRLGGQR